MPFFDLMNFMTEELPLFDCSALRYCPTSSPPVRLTSGGRRGRARAFLDRAAAIRSNQVVTSTQLSSGGTGTGLAVVISGYGLDPQGSTDQWGIMRPPS